MPTKISALRLALAGASTLSILFVLCWVGAVVWAGGLSHMFVAIFTAAPVNSWLALGQGVCSAIVFGALTGIILAISYNAFAIVDRMEQKP